MVNNEAEPSIEGGGKVALAPPEYLGGMGGGPLPYGPAGPASLYILQVCNNNKKGANILVLHKWIKFIVELCTWVLKKFPDGPLVWLNGILTSTAINLIQIF